MRLVDDCQVVVRVETEVLDRYGRMGIDLAALVEVASTSAVDVGRNVRCVVANGNVWHPELNPGRNEAHLCLIISL